MTRKALLLTGGCATAAVCPQKMYLMLLHQAAETLSASGESAVEKAVRIENDSIVRQP